MASVIVSDDDSGDDFIPKRRSVKNAIASDDEDGDSDTALIRTEDITLCLSDEGENQEIKEGNNAFAVPDDATPSNVSHDIPEGLNGNNDDEEIPKEPCAFENLLLSPKIKTPSRSMIDSDSEPEETLRQSAVSDYSKGGYHSEVSSDAEPASKAKSKQPKPKNSKPPNIWDSDTDSEEDKPVKTKNSSSLKLSLVDSDSDEADQPRKDLQKPSLIDSDSDEGDQPRKDLNPEEGTKKGNRKSKSTAGKQKKTNSKDAMLAIRSESQRMTREAAVSLPYHRPKQHSLHDFLNRRRLAPSSMKASVEELVKFQKEGEKVIKEFYQSESEQSDDDENDDPDWKEEEDKNGNKDEEKESSKDTETENLTRTGDTEDMNLGDKGTDYNKIDEREAGHESDEDKEAGNKQDGDVEMETEEISPNGRLSDQSDTGEKKDKSVLVNTEKKDAVDTDQDCVLLESVEEESRIVREKEELVGEKENAKPVKNTVPSPDKNYDTEEDTQKIEEFEQDKSDERKQTDSCPIDSQNLELKYSKDFSESTVSQKLNVDFMTDSENEDVQMVDPPKEVPKLKLIGNPNDVIDLYDDFITYKSKTEDVEGLKTRFMRHSLTVKPKASPTTLSLTIVDRASDGSIKGINEKTITWTPEEVPVDLTPPGLKMKMLKMELQRQIVEQREQEFRKKETLEESAEKEGYEDGEKILDDKEDSDDAEAEAGNDLDVEDEVDCDAEDDDEDDDEDADEIDEDEDEDVDEYLDVSRKKKNAFVDEEASVDDDFDENSADLDDKNGEDDDSSGAKKSQFSRTDTNVDMFASQMSDDDDNDEIPAYQPCGGRRNPSPLSQPHNSVTPSIPSTSESLHLPEITQVSPNSSFQRILPFYSDFDSEEVDISTTQILGRDLKKDTENEKKVGIMLLAQNSEVPETEADLMAMCSGQFVTQPFPLESQAGNLNSSVDSHDSQDLQLKWTDDSPADKPKTQKKVGVTRLVIESSDEEDDGDEAATKRKTRRLSFSDDESNSVGVDDFINDEEEEEEEDQPAPEDVMYDSDENEIPVKGDAFLENEAELSEDDYVGSGDEDEGGDNDQMEEELGDMDDFDQDQVREELGRIHMRNLLDDDRRDVRLMQEMLLEDEEDHEDGKGRQRQFRWKNADLATLMTSQAAGSDEEGQDDDEEDDGGWRQNRHDREMFLANCLKEKQEKGEVIELEEQQEDSELMVLGKTILKKQSSTRFEVKETVSKPQQQFPDSPIKSLHSRARARGSFLSRTSDVLTRLAQNASGRNGIVETKTKNSRNFVFAVVSPPKNEENGVDVENEPRPNAKRKAVRSLIAQPEKKMCSSQPKKYSGLFDYL